MSIERNIPCAFNPLLSCDTDCRLYKRNKEFVEGYEEGLEITESEFAEKLRTEFNELTPGEQGRRIMTKINILEQKDVASQDCMRFEESQSQDYGSSVHGNDA